MYGFSIKIFDSFENVVQLVINALKTQGFGVLTKIDVQATLKEKLNVNKPSYMILGACNPQLANQALEIEPDIGLLLPCNVIIREDIDKSITVAFMDPMIISNLVKKTELTDIAHEALARLEKVRDILSSK